MVAIRNAGAVLLGVGLCALALASEGQLIAALGRQGAMLSVIRVERTFDYVVYPLVVVGVTLVIAVMGVSRKRLLVTLAVLPCLLFIIGANFGGPEGLAKAGLYLGLAQALMTAVSRQDKFRATTQTGVTVTPK
jgi:hypothetical protein